MKKNKYKESKESLEDSLTLQNQNKLIFKKYRIVQKISEGTFGNIYSVINNQNKYFAMKTESKDSKFQLLKKEGYILISLKGIGFPNLISFGVSNNYHILIQQYLGKSLFDLFLYYRDKLTIQDKCLIAIQLISRIQFLHSKTFIHRDIKPHNFLLGIQDPNIIYLTEFRLCSKYKSSKTGKHIHPGFRGTFTGNLRFSSANAQRGMQQSRRDDLECIGYIILLSFVGALPWDYGENFDWNMSEKDIYLKTYKIKKFISIEKLCKDCPKELEEYFKYVRSLKFEEEPDYQKLKNFFIEVIKNNEKIVENNININFDINNINNINNINDINEMSFSWVRQLNDKSKSKSKSKSKNKNGYKSRLYHKLIENFENKRIRERTLDINNNININNINNSVEKGEKIQNILKKSTEYNTNPKNIMRSLTQGNQSNTINNLINIKKNTKNINNNMNMNNIGSFENYKKIKNINLKNNTQRSPNYNLINTQINKKPIITSRERYNINNNINNNTTNNEKINNYRKINNTQVLNNIKKIYNNNTITQKNRLNLNMNMNMNNVYNINNHINTNNYIQVNNSQNIRPISNNLNKQIIRKPINLNINKKVIPSNSNLENKYKKLNINKNRIYQQNMNYNKNFQNSFNQKNFQNNYLLNQYQTYNNDNNNNIFI